MHEGAPFVVSREERDTFERVTWVSNAYPDDDPEGFPEDIVEGFHSLALLDAVSAKAAPLGGPGIMGYNYGLDRVRFPTPVKVDSRIRARTELVSVEQVTPNALQLKRKVTIDIDGEAKPACIAETLARLVFA